MTKNIVSMAAALLGAGALLTGCNFSQPSAGCIVQDGSWVAKYDLQEGTPISEACQAKLKIGVNATYKTGGEVLGVFKFTDPQKPDSSVLTLRPQGLYSRATLDPKNGDSATGELAQTAVGALSDETVEDFCSTSDWKSATVEPRPSVSEPTSPPTTVITYEFSNVKMYSAPDAPGTQLSADLTYTRDDCTGTFKVRAIWPPVGCNPDSQKESEKCGEGSGINPDFAVQCDTSFRVNNTKDDDGNIVYPGSCVPANDIPSFTKPR